MAKRKQQQTTVMAGELLCKNYHLVATAYALCSYTLQIFNVHGVLIFMDLVSLNYP